MVGFSARADNYRERPGLILHLFSVALAPALIWQESCFSPQHSWAGVLWYLTSASFHMSLWSSVGTKQWRREAKLGMSQAQTDALFLVKHHSPCRYVLFPNSQTLSTQVWASLSPPKQIVSIEGKEKSQWLGFERLAFRWRIKSPSPCQTLFEFCRTNTGV